MVLCLALVPLLGPAAMEIRVEIAHLANLERRKQGLAPLKIVESLMSAAEGHAEDMAAKKYFDHKSLDGRQFWQRCQKAGYTGSPRGENIALGAGTADRIVSMWMNSEGHRKNILNPDIREVGIGLAGARHLAVMVTGVSDREFPLVIDNEAYRANGVRVPVFAYGKGIAVQMRLSFDGQTWTPPRPFAAEFTQDLPPGGGPKTLWIELIDANGQTTQSKDTILSR